MIRYELHRESSNWNSAESGVEVDLFFHRLRAGGYGGVGRSRYGLLLENGFEGFGGYFSLWGQSNRSPLGCIVFQWYRVARGCSGRYLQEYVGGLGRAICGLG